MDKKTLTVAEAANVLGVSRASAYNAIRRGDIRAIRIGRRIVVPVVAVEALLGGANER